MKILQNRINNIKVYYIIAVFVSLIVIALLLQHSSSTAVNKDKDELGKPDVLAKGIFRPQGLVSQKDGKVFVQSAVDGKIFMINKDGTVFDYTYIKDYYGYGIDVDIWNNFLIASKSSIVEIDNSGIVNRTIRGFEHAYDVKNGPDKTIFVSDSQRSAIYKINSKGHMTEFIKFEYKPSEEVPNTAGICFDNTYKNLYAVNMFRGELYKISLNEKYEAEKVETIVSNLKRPNFIAVDEQGNAYITCTGDNSVVRVDANSIVEQFDTKGKFLSPSGIALSGDKDRFLYVASKDTNTVYKFNLSYNQNKK